MISLSLLFNNVGKHRHMPDSHFDSKQLKIGTQIELEHTDDLNIAKEIAKDHLAECKDYYTRLIKLEKDCESKSA
jgi:hypothetical protein